MNFILDCMSEYVQPVIEDTSPKIISSTSSTFIYIGPKDEHSSAKSLFYICQSYDQADYRNVGKKKIKFPWQNNSSKVSLLHYYVTKWLSLARNGVREKVEQTMSWQIWSHLHCSTVFALHWWLELMILEVFSNNNDSITDRYR